MRGSPPLVVVVAGPNGAGKSTFAPRLLRGALAVTEFASIRILDDRAWTILQEVS